MYEISPILLIFKTMKIDLGLKNINNISIEGIGSGRMKLKFSMGIPKEIRLKIKEWFNCYMKSGRKLFAYRRIKNGGIDLTHWSEY